MRNARGDRAPEGTFGATRTAGVPVAGADRKMIRQQSPRAPDQVLGRRLRELANERSSCGYRRGCVLLRCDGKTNSGNRRHRDQGQRVAKRKALRKAVGTQAPIAAQARANACPSRQIVAQSGVGQGDPWRSSTTSSPMVSALGGGATWLTT